MNEDFFDKENEGRKNLNDVFYKKTPDMPAQFRKGDLVVCMDADFKGIQRAAIRNLPNAHDIYTVRDVYVYKDDHEMLYLEELVNEAHMALDNISLVEPAFLCTRFELLQEVEIGDTLIDGLLRASGLLP
jgi:hypothetical protein